MIRFLRRYFDNLEQKRMAKRFDATRNAPRLIAGKYPIDCWGLDVATQREMIYLPRPYAGEYVVDGWRVDATPESHERFMELECVWAWVGPAGSVLTFQRGPTLKEPVPYEESVWIEGVTSCPRCAQPLRFAAVEASDAHVFREECEPCDGMAADMHVVFGTNSYCVTSKVNLGSTSDAFFAPGPWQIGSTRIDRITIVPDYLDWDQQQGFWDNPSLVEAHRTNGEPLR